MRTALGIATFLLGMVPAFAAASGNVAEGSGSLIASSAVDFVIKIPRVLSMRLLDHPRSVTLDEQDVARGAIVVRGARLDIAANPRGGYLLRAELAGQAFTGVEIVGLERTLRSRGEPVVALMRAALGRPRSEPLQVEYRLSLAANARPGTYAWPVALSVEAP